MSRRSPKDGKSEGGVPNAEGQKPEEEDSAPSNGGLSGELHDEPGLENPTSKINGTSAFDIPHSEIDNTSDITMEVHHHPKVEKKSLKEYLLEGLMIFLAVTMGFFAENLRERISDNHRESEFAKALYNELSADSAAAAKILEVRLGKEKDLDYLHAYFKDSSLTDLPRRFYPAYTVGLYIINSVTFEPRDGILSQLKNSGGMQYFKSVTLQKLLGDLIVSINNIRYRSDQEYQFFAAPLKPFLLKHYDFGWLDKVRKAIPSKGSLVDVINMYGQSTMNIKAGILNTNAFDRSEAANLVMFDKQMLTSTRSLQLNNYVVINHKILEVLRKTYTLEDE
jgi:hypothetical protein